MAGATAGRSDLMVSASYDLIIEREPNGDLTLLKADRNSLHSFAQAIYLCLQTIPGEFEMKESFGASPRSFIGSAITPQLIADLESYIRLNIKNSGVNPDGFNIVVKAAPIKRDTVAIRVMVTSRNEALIKIDMAYSTSDNQIYPLNSSKFGG